MKSIVKIAQELVGRKESDGSHQYIIDTYNAIRPLPGGYKLKYTDAWCAGFVSACAWLAEIKNFPFECSCSRMIAKLQKAGLWEEKDDHTPAPGDLIFYDWNDSGKGDNTGAPEHVGLVEKVTDDTVTIIEGNYSNSVKRRKIRLNARYIRGYGLTSALIPAEPKQVTRHTVKRGETLWGLATRYLGSGIRYRDIMTANGLNTSTIYPGQVLTIPER